MSAVALLLPQCFNPENKSRWRNLIFHLMMEEIICGRKQRLCRGFTVLGALSSFVSAMLIRSEVSPCPPLSLPLSRFGSVCIFPAAVVGAMMYCSIFNVFTLRTRANAEEWKPLSGPPLRHPASIGGAAGEEVHSALYLFKFFSLSPPPVRLQGQRHGSPLLQGPPACEPDSDRGHRQDRIAGRLPAGPPALLWRQ